MFATLTRKGQLTLPKEIRDRLNLDAGTILDFQIQADNTTTAPAQALSPRAAHAEARSCFQDRID